MVICCVGQQELNWCGIMFLWQEKESFSWMYVYLFNFVSWIKAYLDVEFTHVFKVAFELKFLGWTTLIIFYIFSNER